VSTCDHDIAKGLEIIEGLRGHTSGLAIPQYVIDAPGGGGKVPVNPRLPARLRRPSAARALRNFQGREFDYHERTPVAEVARQKALSAAAGASKWAHRGFARDGK
jgi:lysine 2,3-aminomutase